MRECSSSSPTSVVILPWGAPVTPGPRVLLPRDVQVREGVPAERDACMVQGLGSHMTLGWGVCPGPGEIVAITGPVQHARPGGRRAVCVRVSGAKLWRRRNQYCRGKWEWLALHTRQLVVRAVAHLLHRGSQQCSSPCVICVKSRRTVVERTGPSTTVKCALEIYGKVVMGAAMLVVWATTQFWQCLTMDAWLLSICFTSPIPLHPSKQSIIPVLFWEIVTDVLLWESHWWSRWHTAEVKLTVTWEWSAKFNSWCSSVLQGRNVQNRQYIMSADLFPVSGFLFNNRNSLPSTTFLEQPNKQWETLHSKPKFCWWQLTQFCELA